MRPTTARQVAIVARYELLKYLRGRRLPAIVLLTAIIGAIYIVVPPAIGSQYLKDPIEFITDQLGFLGILSVLSATFFGADAIVSEFESKTGHFLFPNPLRKTTIFLGKFIASALVSVGVIALYYLIAVTSVRVIDGGVPARTGLSFAYSLVYLFAILAIAYLYSAVMRSSVHSLILTSFTLLLILPIFDLVSQMAKFKAWFSITFASRIATNVLQDPYPTDKVITTTAGGAVDSGSAQMALISRYYPSVPVSLAVLAAYFIVAFLVAIALTKRRDM
jgi:ABC-2 type transport system permease protein